MRKALFHRLLQSSTDLIAMQLSHSELTKS